MLQQPIQPEPAQQGQDMISDSVQRSWRFGMQLNVGQKVEVFIILVLAAFSFSKQFF